MKRNRCLTVYVSSMGDPVVSFWRQDQNTGDVIHHGTYSPSASLVGLAGEVANQFLKEGRGKMTAWHSGPVGWNLEVREWLP